MTEAQHQVQVFKWALQPSVRIVYPELKLLHHIPNGGKRDPIEAKHLKQQGSEKRCSRFAFARIKRWISQPLH